MLVFKKSFPKLHDALIANPIIVVDAGCAGGVDPIFTDLSKSGYADNIGFEANPAEAEKLRQISGSRTTIFSMALSDKDGPIRFHAHGTVGSVFPRPDREILYGETYEDLQVDGASLDSLRARGVLSRPIDVLKLDVEGSELSILKGAQNSLANEILCIKVEFDFHAPLGKNNFGELHLRLNLAGFLLMGLAVNNSVLSGLDAGDALYVRRPESIMNNADLSDLQKRVQLLHLAAICVNLRQISFLALLARLGAAVLTKEEGDELRALAASQYFIPNVAPFAFPRVAQAIFALSQFTAGAKHRSKSAPKVNRLIPLRILFARVRWDWMRRWLEKKLANMVDTYLTRAGIER